MAALAALFAAEQLAAARRLQLEVLAVESWDQMLELSLANPELADGRAFKYCGTPEDDEPVVDRDKCEKYRWFVSRLLFSVERLKVAFPKDRGWDTVANNQMKYHCEYFETEWVDERRDEYEPVATEVYSNACG
jgi:uncharacterized protein YbdZ (MbtH family)